MNRHNKTSITGTAAALLLCLVPGATNAEITTDGTMGPATSLTGPDFAITEDLGTRRGANRFHSFQRFGIASGESATFSGAADISNVINRVTGGEASGIDGALRSPIPNADVYLVNPAGIVYEIGCFRRAPGCLPFGPSSGEFAWFSGYIWQVVYCRGCQQHLGWMFSGEDRFFGLIVNKLAEA